MEGRTNDERTWSTPVLDEDSRMSASVNSSSIVNQLQQHILKLCNEKVAYLDKLQILGVVCLSIDNVPNEVIIKLNSTLKKVDSGLSPVAIDPSPSSILTPPPTLAPAHFSAQSRRKRSVPMRHVDKESLSDNRDAASFLSSSEDDESDPSCKLQLSCLSRSPSEPGEVKRLKCDDALDFSTTKALQEIELPFDFSRSTIQTVSPLSIPTNSVFNAQPNFMDNGIIQDNSLKSLIKPIDHLTHSSFEQIGYRHDRHENEFMVDKLGMEGKKRRRRAPDESLTNEEILEYMGGIPPAEIVKREGEKFTCNRCYEQCDDLSKYLRHTLVVHSAYICHECGRNFTTKSSLLRHRPIHTGMRRFACGICKKAFYRKDKCKAHIKRHLLDLKTDINRIHGPANLCSPTLTLQPGLCNSPAAATLNVLQQSLQLLPHNIAGNHGISDIAQLVSSTPLHQQSSAPPQIAVPTAQIPFQLQPIKQERVDSLYESNKLLVKSFCATEPISPMTSAFSNIKVPTLPSSHTVSSKSTPAAAATITTPSTAATPPANVTASTAVPTTRSHPVPTTTSLQANTIASSAFNVVASI